MDGDQERPEEYLFGPPNLLGDRDIKIDLFVADRTQVRDETSRADHPEQLSLYDCLPVDRQGRFYFSGFLNRVEIDK